MGDVSERKGHNRIQREIQEENDRKVPEGRPVPQDTFKALVDGSIFLREKSNTGDNSSPASVSEVPREKLCI